MTASVRYRIAACQVGTKTEIAGVRVGQEFDLVVFVKDLRVDGSYEPEPGRTLPKPRGVFAAYCNVVFQTYLARVQSVTHSPTYPNGKNGIIDSTGLRELGSFASSFAPLGKYEYEVVRARIKARNIFGTLRAACTFTPLTRPSFDTLVYAAVGVESQYISSEEIEASGFELQITA